VKDLLQDGGLSFLSSAIGGEFAADL